MRHPSARTIMAPLQLAGTMCLRTFQTDDLRKWPLRMLGILWKVEETRLCSIAQPWLLIPRTLVVQRKVVSVNSRPQMSWRFTWEPYTIQLHLAAVTAAGCLAAGLGSGTTKLNTWASSGSGVVIVKKALIEEISSPPTYQTNMVETIVLFKSKYCL